MGLKITHQNLSRLLKNPFYCGLIVHNALEGKVVEGKQEKLIPHEIFLKVNDIQSQNHHGYKTTQENNDIPLKRFLRCDVCGSFMRGYLVHKKNIHYYKCNTPGCKNNKNAEALHDVFKNKLSKYTFDIQSKHLIKTQMIATYNQSGKEQMENEKTLTAQLNEVNKKIERLEERFVLEEIPQELFKKFKTKFIEEKDEIQRQLAKSGNKGSNLLECVDDAMNFCRKLPVLWELVGYTGKQRLQFLMFPQGIRYNKETDECRTEEENEFALKITNQSKSYNGSEKNKRGKSCDVAPLVARMRIELMFPP